MRYHYEKPNLYVPLYGRVYICNHPVYDRCTLFEIGTKGLAVIQQRFDPESKKTWWTDIDPWLANDLYLHEGFVDYFNSYAAECKDGLYPTVTIRQIMWSLKMKPIPRQRWETTFDHRDI